MSQCMKADCEEEATHTVRLVFPDKTDPTRNAWGMLDGLRLCEDHADEVDPAAFVRDNPGLLEAVARESGLDPFNPNMDAASAEAIEVGSAQHKAFIAGASNPTVN